MVCIFTFSSEQRALILPVPPVVLPDVASDLFGRAGVPGFPADQTYLGTGFPASRGERNRTKMNRKWMVRSGPVQAPWPITWGQGRRRCLV